MEKTQDALARVRGAELLGTMDICGCSYEIFLADEIDDAHALHDGARCKIYIERNTPDMMHDAFVHEVLHGILSKSGISRDLEKASIDEEWLVHSLTPWLRMTFEIKFRLLQSALVGKAKRRSHR